VPVRRWSTPVSYGDLQQLRAERAVGAGLGLITGPLPSHLPWPTIGAQELDPRIEIERRGAEAALAAGFVDAQYPERASQAERRGDAVVEAGVFDPTHPDHVRSSPMRARQLDRGGASDRALELVHQVLGGGPPPDAATELTDLAVAIHLRRNDLPAAIALVQRALRLVEPKARVRLEDARQGWERMLATARAAANRTPGRSS
jgi:hypothetical protein